MDNSRIAVSKYLTQIEEEIRIPITSIIGNVEHISRENADAGLHDSLVSIRLATDKLIRLTDDIVDIIRISNGELEIAEDDYDFEDVLLDIRHLIEKYTAQKSLEHEIVIDRNIPCRFFGDKKRVSKMLRRLVRGAIEATDSGTVKFHASCMPGSYDNMFLRFDVSDSGNGELAEDITATLAGKTAIGEISETATSVFIIKYIAGKMGGKFTARAKKGEGCTFTILISQKPVGIATFNDRMRESEEENSEHTFVLEKGRALVVSGNRETALSGLQTLYQYNIGSDITDNSEQAIRMLSRIKYDLVLSDEDMKFEDGNFLVDEICKLGSSSDEGNAGRAIPVIGIGSGPDVGEAVEKKYFAHAAIPFQREELEKILLGIFPTGRIKYIVNHSYEGKGIESLQQLGLNSAEAFSRFGSDEEGYKKAVLSVCRSSDTRGKMLNFYLEQSDYKNYIVIIRSMIDASMLIGAEKLAEKGRNLEKSVKYNPSTELVEETAEYADEFEKTFAAVRGVMTNVTEENNKGAIDRQDLIYLIGELRGYLSDYRLNEAEQLFFTLAQFSYADSKVMELIHEAEEYMLVYNYNEVMAVLDKIMTRIEGDI